MKLNVLRLLVVTLASAYAVMLMAARRKLRGLEHSIVLDARNL